VIQTVQTVSRTVGPFLGLALQSGAMAVSTVVAAKLMIIAAISYMVLQYMSTMSKSCAEHASLRHNAAASPAVCKPCTPCTPLPLPLVVEDHSPRKFWRDGDPQVEQTLDTAMLSAPLHNLLANWRTVQGSFGLTRCLSMCTSPIPQNMTADLCACVHVHSAWPHADSADIFTTVSKLPLHRHHPAGH
jgi:hypothetical protein